MLKLKTFLILSGLLLTSVNVKADTNFKVIGYQKYNTVKRFDHSSYQYLDQLIYKLIRVKSSGELELLPSTISDINLLQQRKRKNKHTTPLLIGVGGAKFNSKHFAQMASQRQSRERFAQQLVQFCLEHQLNGVDVDWEYPRSREEKINAQKMFKELHRQFNPHDLTLTAAINYAPDQIKFAKHVEPYVDQINLMVYEPMEGLATFHQQIDYAITLVEQELLDKSKLYIGLPFYGKSLKTGDALPFYEIQMLANHEQLPNDIHYFKPSDVGFYTSKFKRHGFAGVMFWELGFDDNNGSLLKAINNAHN